MFDSRVMKIGLLSAAVALLAACNDDDALRGGHDDHGHDHVETTGRLVIGHADGAASRAVVYDLDDGEEVGALALSTAPSGIYASPGKRYAVVVQAAEGRVNFIDGGVWQHGDHAHADAPELLSFERAGSRPAHYRAHEDQAALFYDGEGANPASFDLFNDTSLSQGSIVASHTLPASVHGIAEPRGGFVLALDYSAEDASTGAVRSFVKLFEQHGDHFHDEGRFETPCENLHGGSSNEDYSAFGCTDGILLIHQEGDVFTDSKIETPQRITQVAGHHAVEVFAAFAGDGTMYVVNPVTGTATTFDWNGEDDNVARRLHAFDAHGEHLLILDVNGVLHVLEAHGDHFDAKGSVQVLDADSTTARITTSAASAQAFVTDPAGRAIAVIDLDTVDIVDYIDLTFEPLGIAWVGIPVEGDHDHDHDHAH